MNAIKLVLVLLLLVLVGLVGCEKDEKIEFNDNELCQYLNSENIDKTVPIINDFLANQKKGLDDEQYLEALIKWLKKHPCVVDAVILQESTIYEVLITFEENGIRKDYVLDMTTTNPFRAQLFHRRYSPQDVFVKTKKDFTINNVFNFINSLDFEVELIYNGVYVSTMSSDNLDLILDSLNSKSYTNDGSVWWTTGYLHYKTKQITVFPRLYNIKNTDYQEDWLNSMRKYQLIESMDYDHSGYIIHFKVPEGKEKQWETQFKNYEFVEWAELNYYGHIELHRK